MDLHYKIVSFYPITSLSICLQGSMKCYANDHFDFTIFALLRGEKSISEV